MNEHTRASAIVMKQRTMAQPVDQCFAIRRGDRSIAAIHPDTVPQGQGSSSWVPLQAVGLPGGRSAPAESLPYDPSTLVLCGTTR